MASLVSVELHRVLYHLFLGDVLEHQEVRLILIVIVFCLCHCRVWAIETLRSSCCAHPWAACSSSRTWSSARASGVAAFFFDVSEHCHDLAKLVLPRLFLLWCLAYTACSWLVYEVASAWSSCNNAVNSSPIPLEITLNLLKPIQCAHLIRLLGRWRLRSSLFGLSLRCLILCLVFHFYWFNFSICCFRNSNIITKIIFKNYSYLQNKIL